jgi:hypothetical protein
MTSNDYSIIVLLDEWVENGLLILGLRKAITWSVNDAINKYAIDKADIVR